MSRYTRQDLYAELKEINKSLVGTGYYLAANSRNGYTGVDEYRGDASEGTAGKCVRNIQCGSPRACRDAAYEYAAPEA
jgi:hypothetical protein